MSAWKPIRLFGLFLLMTLSISHTTKLGRAQNTPEQDQSEKKRDLTKEGLPLEPKRKIDFGTSEGTWLSLDVSPDGKTVLFELLGDLYTVPIEGGEATRITEGMAFDSQPAFSPDGQWIAFISDRDGAENLWIAKADGTEPKKLTKGKKDDYVSPGWTPDGQYVIVSKGGRSQDLWMYHIQGGTGVSITGTKGDKKENTERSSRKSRLGAVMDPEGRYLYWAQKDSGSVYNQLSFDWEIYRRDMVTGEEDRLTQAEFGAFRPVLSPDGSRIVYGTRLDAETGLRIRNLHSGEDRWLKLSVQRDDMESRGTRDLFPGYTFTPDGQEIVVTWGGKIWRVNINSGEETEVPFQAHVTQDLGPLLNVQRRVEEGPVRSRLIQDPSQSPDGNSIVFSAMAKLYVMDLQTGESRRLTTSDDNEFKPSWSADGKSVTYVTWNYQRAGQIWKVPADGSGTPQQLTTVPAFYTDPVYSPDGTRIVARRGNAWMRSQTPSEFGGLRISLDLIWLPAGGGDSNLIVPARGLGSPHFGPERDRIYFYSREGLISMRYDGTDRRRHLKVTGKGRAGSPEPAPAQEVLLSPTGKWALAKADNQVFLLSVPAVGGDGTSVSVHSPAVPVRQLTNFGADSFRWAGNGETITWAVGSTFFRRPFNSVSFEAEEKQETKEDDPPDDDPAASGENGTNPQQEEQTKQPPKKANEEDEAVESFEVHLEFPRHRPQGIVVLRGATVIPMNGDQVIAEADLIVENNRIRAVGQKGSLEIPEGARQFDLKGKFIVPGFIDTHAHYEMRTEGVLELHNWSFLSNLAYGVTTGLDVQTSTNDYLTYQDLVEAGMMLGPRPYSTGPGVFSNNDFQSAAQARWVIEKYKRFYRNHNLKSYMVGNRKQRQWVVQAANELGLTVTTEGGLDLKLDMTHAIDGFGGNEHSLPIVPLYRDVVELFARSGTSYTPTLLVLYGGPWAENYFYETTEVHADRKLNRFIPHNELDKISRRRPWFHPEEHSFSKTAAQAAKIQRAGGHVGVGGHGQLQGLGYHWEMWALAMGGMTPQEVLKAATIDGAYIIGLEQDLGSIEAGKLADLVILNKNPLEDIRHTNSILYVMKDGELFEGDTLKQVWPGQQEIPPFWWWQGPTSKYVTSEP